MWEDFEAEEERPKVTSSTNGCLKVDEEIDACDILHGDAMGKAFDMAEQMHKEHPPPTVLGSRRESLSNLSSIACTTCAAI